MSDPTSTGSFAFLFDSTAPGVGGWYGGVFDPAFLAALSQVDPSGQTRSWVLRGDSIPSKLSERVKWVENQPNGVSYALGNDSDQFATIIWDWADAVSGQWNTLDLQTVPLLLAREALYCIVLPTLPMVLAAPIDAALRGCLGYCGGLEFDLGNPVQNHIFVRMLIKDAVIADGAVYLARDLENELSSSFEGGDVFKPRGVRVVPYGGLEAIATLPTQPMSERGRVSLERVEGKRNLTVQARVVGALASRGVAAKGQMYRFDQLDLANAVEDATLPEAKFVQYLLNADHPSNNGKAKFFEENLGLTKADWRYLASQLHDGLKLADLTELEVKSFDGRFGASFNATIPVRGLNGNSVMVETNWIMEPGKQPSLSTVKPAHRSLQVEQPLPEPAIIAPTIPDVARWAEILMVATKAGEAAATAFVPTPMKIVGEAIEMEGKCGSASVIISDKRAGFGGWLIKSGKAYRTKEGADFHVMYPSQSVDRARAYAKAFALVLQHNGIACTITSRLS